MTRTLPFIRNSTYGLTTMIFFYIQLHLILQFIVGKGTLLDAVIALVALKAGELIHEKCDFGSFLLWLALAVISTWLVYLQPGFASFLGSFIFGLSMMKVRDRFYRKADRRIKIWSRAIGFLLAPLFNQVIYLVATCLLGLLGAILFIMKDSAVVSPIPWTYRRIQTKENILVYTTMFLHHTHYFIYAYSIPLLFARTSTIPFMLYGLMFYVGWAAYNAYEKIIKPGWGWFIIGHILALGALLALTFVQNPFAVLLLWFITGLGGGTVYMLHSLIPVENDKSWNEMRIAEANGHFLGILFWGILVLYSVESTFLASVSVIILMIALSIFAARRGRLYVSHQNI